MFLKKAIALGTFDGLHPGHRRVLKHPAGYSLTVLTFDIPPKAYFSKKPELLMTLDDRVKAIYDLGAEKVVVLEFEKIKDMNAQDFLEYLLKEYSPDMILCGFNYKFGKDAFGNTSLISDFCNKNGILLSIVEPVLQDGLPISSTIIRNLISSGDIYSANNYIYGGFGFSGPVLHGDNRGHTLGFPTVNQLFPQELIKPKFGVYYGKMIIDGSVFDCVTNIGLRPTFKTENITCESFVFDFSGDIYGQNVTLKPLKFLRAEIKFDNVDDLKNQIIKDIKAAKNLRKAKN